MEFYLQDEDEFSIPTLNTISSIEFKSNKPKKCFNFCLGALANFEIF